MLSVSHPTLLSWASCDTVLDWMAIALNQHGVSYVLIGPVLAVFPIHRSWWVGSNKTNVLVAIFSEWLEGVVASGVTDFYSIFFLR